MAPIGDQQGGYLRLGWPYQVLGLAGELRCTDSLAAMGVLHGLRPAWRGMPLCIAVALVGLPTAPLCTPEATISHVADIWRVDLPL